jgi:uncharacterized cofD-like protein
MEKTKIAVIGGGTGSVVVLTGLKKYKDLELSVIVGMTDDGASNRIVRDEFGLLPLSDLRKSIIALADAGNGTFRKLFTYRFEKGEGLKSHTLGNLMMMALADLTGSEQGAIEAASKVFNVQGKVIPVTFSDVRLEAKYDNGKVIKGEHLIDEPEEDSDARITELYSEPKAVANDEAVTAIMEADYIIAGPGDLYTTTLCNIIVEGIPHAIQKSKGKYVFINNLMSKKGQTHWMKASDLVNEITKYSGREPDFVLSNSGKIPDDILKLYADKGEFPIEDDLGDGDGYQIIRKDIVSNDQISYEKGDVLVRSLIRHDAEELGQVLYNLFRF